LVGWLVDWLVSQPGG